MDDEFFARLGAELLQQAGLDAKPWRLRINRMWYVRIGGLAVGRWRRTTARGWVEVDSLIGAFYLRRCFCVVGEQVSAQ